MPVDHYYYSEVCISAQVCLECYIVTAAPRLKEGGGGVRERKKERKIKNKKEERKKEKEKKKERIVVHSLWGRKKGRKKTFLADIIWRTSARKSFYT